MASRPIDSSSAKTVQGAQAPETRSLVGEEKKADTLGKRILLGAEATKETQTLDVTLERVAVKEQERARFQPPGIAQEATAAQTTKSIQDKWAPNLRAKIMEQEDPLNYAMNCVLDARERIREIREMYRPILASQPSSVMKSEVTRLMTLGDLRSVKGGEGGVYFLYDETGAPRFVIKPGDEAILALNNGKGLAGPYLDSDNVAEPKEGVLIYEAVQNAELAYRAATLLGLGHVTPETEVMILESERFHDIFDGIEERENPLVLGVERAEPTTKEKVCTVQPFLTGFVDVGQLLSESIGMTPEAIKQMMVNDPTEYARLEEQHTVKDIEQAQYEMMSVFAFILGEKDGNAGNFMCAKNAPPAGLSRAAYKIDNSAIFPSNNTDLTTGVEWIPHNYDLPLSQSTKDFIASLSDEQVNQLKILMRERGKSEESIQALDERIDFLKRAAPDAQSIREIKEQFAYNW